MEGSYVQNGEENLGFEKDIKQTNDTNAPARVEMVEFGISSTDHEGLKHRANGSAVNHDDDTGDLVLEDVEFDPERYPKCAIGIMFVQKFLADVYCSNKRLIWIGIGVILLLLYLAYVAYAMYYKFGDEGSIRLLVCTLFGLMLLALSLLGSFTKVVTEPIQNFLSNPNHLKTRRIIRWLLYIASTVATVVVLIVLVALDTPRNLISLAGLAAFILICLVTSNNPAMINWHPVFWGFSIQFYFAVIILRTRWGYEAFQWLGDRVTEFLSYSNAGAAFVFGDYSTLTATDGTVYEFNGVYNFHFFAFQIMPVITFFSTVIAVLYYLGVMQSIIKVIGRFLSFCLGTTPAESLNAAGNIFVAMSESPLMIRPFIPKMTKSELHAIMTGGFATIAGSVLGVYIGFGVPADHLLSASVMSAPAALAISKLTYPETQVPIVHEEDYDMTEKTTEGNVIEAACNGAITSAKIIASVMVNVMAFLSLLKFINATLTWFGDRVGVEDLTFEFICSYVLYPVALFMGTEPDDCRQVAELVGIKTFTNEFIAYQKLSEILGNRKKLDAYVSAYGNTWYQDGDDVVLEGLNNTRLLKGVMTVRSEVIATYALCGFSNFGSMGILLGTLTAMAPRRRPTMAKLIFRAMIAGNIACFFTACIAGLFYEEFD